MGPASTAFVASRRRLFAALLASAGANPPDPALALPMQKLEQIRNQDSPAQLFQLMEGDRKAQKKSGKDW